MAKQQTAMKCKVTAVLPLADVGVDAVLLGAKANRELVLAMNKLGYRNVTVHVQVGQVRLAEEEPPAKSAP